MKQKKDNNEKKDTPIIKDESQQPGNGSDMGKSDRQQDEPLSKDRGEDELSPHVSDDEESPEVVVGLPLEEVEKMEKELEETRQEAQRNFEGWQRALADFTNFKRRTEREQEKVYQNALAIVVKPFLEAIDDLERAIENRPDEGEEAAWSDGLVLIHRKLQNALDAQGIERIEPEEEAFNPNLHEAISHEESDKHESDMVIEVVQPGYVVGDRVIRPALVRVAR